MRKRDRVCFIVLLLLVILLTPSYAQGALQSLNNSRSVLPTAQEIESTNAQLPILVSEGTMWIKLEYDSNTKTERFYYRFTDDVDPDLITSSRIKQVKEVMKGVLRQNANSMARINAGMTYLYIYSSKDNRKLYEIRINKGDF